jgi:hypothetical protein
MMARRVPLAAAAAAAVLCAACAGLSPARQAGRAVFAAVGDVVPQWQDLPAGRAQEGAAAPLAFFVGSVAQPALRFYAVRADLADERVEVAASGAARSERVSSFTRRTGCIAGINALPFAPVSAREGEAREVVGLLVAERCLVSRPDPRYDALVFYENAPPAIIRQGEAAGEGALEGVRHAVGGFRAVLEGGALPARLTGEGAAGTARHPRSAAGLSAEGRYLFLLAIDGRQWGSRGATEAETGLLLRALGASEGLNFDGGGSTALALRAADGTVRVLNRPVHGMVPGRERAVAGCLGVRLRE